MDRGWWIVRGPNGGYVAAVLLRAMAARLGDPGRAPRSLTVHYTAPPAEGLVRIEVQVERSGRSLTTLSARMTQEGRLLALALAAFSASREGPSIAACAHAGGRSARALRVDGRARRIPSPDPRALRHPLGDRRPALLGRKRGPLRRLDQDGGAADRRRLRRGGVRRRASAGPFAWASPEAPLGPVPTIDLTVHFRGTLPCPARGRKTSCSRSSVRARAAKASSRRTAKSGRRTACS